jgi:hypothetical protein
MPVASDVLDAGRGNTTFQLCRKFWKNEFEKSFFTKKTLTLYPQAIKNKFKYETDIY